MTMLEVVFVIVILGALAGTAYTWLVQTRIDSQIALLRSDVATLLKQVPAEVFAQNMNVDDTPPSGYQTWGDWFIEIGSLDKTRWRATKNGVVAISTPNAKNANSANTPLCTGDYIKLDTSTGVLRFDPSKIDESVSVFCKTFAKSYSIKAETIVYLKTTNAMRF